MKTEKPIAIRIENKRQMDAYIGHMKSLGWNPKAGWKELSECSYPDNILFQDGWHYIESDNCYLNSFRTFSTLTGIKCEVEPIKLELIDGSFVLVSKDGVEFNKDANYIAAVELEVIYEAYQSFNDK